MNINERRVLNEITQEVDRICKQFVGEYATRRCIDGLQEEINCILNRWMQRVPWLLKKVKVEVRPKVRKVGRDTHISENEFLVHFIDEDGEEIELDNLFKSLNRAF